MRFKKSTTKNVQKDIKKIENRQEQQNTLYN
jgi:hypothetical protein